MVLSRIRRRNRETEIHDFISELTPPIDQTEILPSPTRQLTEIERERLQIITELKRQPPVPVGLIEVQQGYAKLSRVNEYSGELLETLNKKEQCYTGWNPIVFEINRNIYPKRSQRLFAPKIRVKAYFKLHNEPITRNPFTGGLLDQEKKQKVLIERGVIDQEGYLLDETGKRFNHKKHWVKVDVSDIDFIKGEVHSVKQNELVVDTARSMKKSGMIFDNLIKWIVIGAFILVGFIVFVMSGGI